LKGLWGELFLILQAKSCDILLKYWHVDPDEKYDFSFGELHVEVKVSEFTPRVHEFALEQLRPSSEASVFIASLLLQKSAGGLGMLDLLTEIAKRTKDQRLVAKAWRNVAAALGQELTESLDVKFDPQFARASLRLVRAEQVPCIAVPLPSGVVGARVRVSMDDCLRAHGKPWEPFERKLPKK
jgi:hypothetical protein